MVSITSRLQAETPYSVPAVSKAAYELLPNAKEFALYTLAKPGGTPDELLSLINRAQKAKLPVVLASPNLGLIRESLEGAMKLSGKKQFKDVVIVVIGPTINKELFAPIARTKGFKLICGTYVEKKNEPSEELATRR